MTVFNISRGIFVIFSIKKLYFIKVDLPEYLKLEHQTLAGICPFWNQLQGIVPFLTFLPTKLRTDCNNKWFTLLTYYNYYFY